MADDSDDQPYRIEDIERVIGDLKANRRKRPGDFIATEVEGMLDIEEGRVADLDDALARASDIIAAARLRTLQRYAAGETDRLAVMDRLGMSYSELLDALRDAALDMPIVDADERESMSDVMNAMLDEAGTPRIRWRQ